MSSFTHLCFSPLQRRKTLPPSSEFLSRYFFSDFSQSIDSLCADASMCYRSVQASTIYSYRSSPIFRLCRYIYIYILRNKVTFSLNESATSINDKVCSTAAAIMNSATFRFSVKTVSENPANKLCI